MRMDLQWRVVPAAGSLEVDSLAVGLLGVSMGAPTIAHTLCRSARCGSGGPHTGDNSALVYPDWSCFSPQLDNILHAPHQLGKSTAQFGDIALGMAVDATGLSRDNVTLCV